MLTSLFGDLGSVLDPFGRKNRAAEESSRSFATTAILDPEPAESAQPSTAAERVQRDLVVTGSPAHALREHFAASRTDADADHRLITMFDPMGIWAGSVIKALSDAGGRPIERLMLREQTSLRNLAVIERTSLARRNEETLKIYYADVRVPGRETAEIPMALAERSHLSAVIVGPMDPSGIDALLKSLLSATAAATWRCPHLLFLLPPSAVWIANKVSAVAWPRGVNVRVMNESLTSASAVWNALQAEWNRVKELPGWSPGAVPSLLSAEEFPIKVADLAPAATPQTQTLPLKKAADAAGVQASTAMATAVVRTTRTALDPEHAKRSLADMLGIEGLLGCAVVDSSNGLVIAREQRDDDGMDIDRAAAACAQVLRSHRLAARSMGLTDHIDEVMVSAGNRQQVMRTLTRHPELFLFVLLNRQRTNLALARYKLMEIEKGLV